MSQFNDSPMSNDNNDDSIFVAFYPNIASNKKVPKVGMISSVFVGDRAEIDNFYKIMSF